MNSGPTTVEELQEQLRQLNEQLEITRGELERVRSQLRTSEIDYREVFDAATDMIVVHDIDTGAILDVNEDCIDTAGYSREQFLTGGVEGFSPPEEEYSPQRAMGYMMAAAQGNPSCSSGGSSTPTAASTPPWYTSSGPPSAAGPCCWT